MCADSEETCVSGLGFLLISLFFSPSWPEPQISNVPIKTSRDSQTSLWNIPSQASTVCTVLNITLLLTAALSTLSTQWLSQAQAVKSSYSPPKDSVARSVKAILHPRTNFSLWVPTAVIKYYYQTTWERKGLSLRVYNSQVTEGIQGRNLEARLQEKPLKNHCDWPAPTGFHL